MTNKSARRSLIFLFAVALAIKVEMALASDCDPRARGETPKVTRAIKDLSAMRLTLDKALAQGSSSLALTALANDYRKKEAALAEHLQAGGIMDQEELFARLKTEIAALQRDAQVQDRQAEELRQAHQDAIDNIPGMRAIFHKLPQGRYVWSSQDIEKVSRIRTALGKWLGPPKEKPFPGTVIKKSFYMMATPVTQKIWTDIVLLARLGPDDTLPLNPDSESNDTKPLVGVTLEDVNRWIALLNTRSKRGHPGIVDIIPDHKTGDVYRLPTMREWEYVTLGCGKYSMPEYFLTDETDLGEYTWSKENSGGTVHSAGLKKPLIIEGMAFYDLLGNVAEITYSDDGGVLVTGFSALSPRSLTRPHSSGIIARSRFNDASFRLIREER